MTGSASEEFLAKYSFDRSRSYLLIHDGKSYDSKAIVSAAHGVGAGNQPLPAGQFNGGEATVGRLLRRLGFTVEVSGGPDTAELIGRITGLTVDRSSGKPALYQPITLLWAIGRASRGEPRMESWGTTRRQVAELLERHGQGARSRADYPVAALRHQGHGKVVFMQPEAALACAADRGDGDGWRRLCCRGRPSAGG
jgi:5-methylcytosine-specific restriction protein A